MVQRMFERHRDAMARRKSGEANELGFTLIELLIVIIVLGILAAIVVFSLTGVSGQSKTAACTTDAKSVEIANDAYQTKNNTYASAVSDLVPSYLKSVPLTTNGYTISLVAGVVNVTIGGTTTPFSDATGCPTVP